LNAHDVTDVVILEEETINQEATIYLWDTVEKQHPTGRVIHICDNARYYHGKRVKSWLNDHPRTTVVPLPAYAPNLNLIERLWKYLRKEVISSHFYETFAEFKWAIMDFFKNIDHHKSKLESLLTLNFQIISSPRTGVKKYAL
jgi:transposase